MKIEYKFNREELNLICECLKQAGFNSRDCDFIEKTNLLKKNIISVLNLEQDLNEVV